MRKAGCAAVLTVAVAITAGCSGGVQRSTTAGALPSGTIANAGRWLTDAQGRVVDLHGVNVVAKDAPYDPQSLGFDDADAAWLGAQGLRVVRLGVMASGEMPKAGEIDQGYVKSIATMVDDLGRHGVYTLLDWHQDDYGTYFDQPGYRADGFPAWMTVTNGAPNHQVPFPFDYTSDPALQEAFQAFWNDEKLAGTAQGLQDFDLAMMEAVASRVKDNHFLLGYEIMNEPWPGTTWLPCLYANGCPQLEASELEPFYESAARTIRSVDPVHMIFFEPFVTFNFGTAPTHLAMPPGVRNTGLAFHQYAQSPAAEKNLFDLAIAWGATGGGALFNTEWSVTNDSPPTITQQADLADGVFMPWTYWIFEYCDIACSGPGVANMINDGHRPPSNSNLNTPVVDAVVRPYPLAVAGTPGRLSYDASSRQMTFVWSTKRAGAPGSFGSGSPTSFATPPIDYPHGYSVHVTGGRAVSIPGATTLVVSQVGQPSTLMVTVRGK